MKPIMKKKAKNRLVSAAMTSLLYTTFMVATTQAEDFKPEVLTVEKTIAAGPNVFVEWSGWDAASKIHIYSQADLSYKGFISSGLTSQFITSHDGKTLYLLSTYMKRFTTGPIESVLEIYDISTLTKIKEVVLSGKAAMSIAMNGLLEHSSDDKYVYVQNATPATSVSVVDVASGTVLTEVPTPGCYGIIPATSGYKFSTLCGSGQIKTVALKGTEYTLTASEKIFDVDSDALFIHSERRGNGDLIFTSFNGNLYLVSDKDEKVKLKEKIAVSADIEGNWAPGGYSITAYNKPNDMVFMIMHPDAEEGSHKDASTEIWAYSLKQKKLLSRSAAEGLIALDATQDKIPKLFGSNENDESVDMFAPTKGTKFDYEKTGSDARVLWTTALMVSK